MSALGLNVNNKQQATVKIVAWQAGRGVQQNVPRQIRAVREMEDHAWLLDRGNRPVHRKICYVLRHEA